MACIELHPQKMAKSLQTKTATTEPGKAGKTSDWCLCVGWCVFVTVFRGKWEDYTGPVYQVDVSANEGYALEVGEKKFRKNY